MGPEEPEDEVLVSEGSEMGADTTDVGACGTELEEEAGSGAVAMGSTARNKGMRYLATTRLNI